ncbi:hypothetical protein B296_00020800 [Ensete ventricosum]|uniref:Uncharacterized protein n=1 Tax=Ensete ventricosum TaxID=4639 RepID=A0A427A0E1_ENSVE|nr:hypothetical protein B296_00020800 [Ensete ventricosum]
MQEVSIPTDVGGLTNSDLNKLSRHLSSTPKSFVTGARKLGKSLDRLNKLWADLGPDLAGSPALEQCDWGLPTPGVPRRLGFRFHPEFSDDGEGCPWFLGHKADCEEPLSA